ncbi:hypothetical protein E2C01_044872 [Portunus trituberculatus]|uniref:Endonuclease/exonuclease/phosphatase domain-containing protein n=1 Tax=Portunus trituberculatus TaxID=210409 RepID=A0A5B7G0B9_PORTR|nr:hypothetical protein [Portunus trituberculatus]
MTETPRSRHQLTVLSANVRGLRTNIGDLTHSFVLRHRVDIAVATETWLNSDVEPTFGKIAGYTHWIRRDRQGRQGGGVAVCLKKGVQAQTLDIVTPPETEALFLRVVLADSSAILLCATYRLPRQGPAFLDFLTEHLDDLQTRHNCRHFLIVGNLNHQVEGAAYENLLTVQGLTDHRQHAPHCTYTSKPMDQPWFSYRCRLAAERKRQDSHEVAAELSSELNLIKECRDRWQIKFAPTKIQANIVSQPCAAFREVEKRVRFGEVTLPLEDHIKVFGVNVSTCTFRQSHGRLQSESLPCTG